MNDDDDDCEEQFISYCHRMEEKAFEEKDKSILDLFLSVRWMQRRECNRALYVYYDTIVSPSTHSLSMSMCLLPSFSPSCAVKVDIRHRWMCLYVQ